jgi:membrane-associated phospholipid phosphatase
MLNTIVITNYSKLKWSLLFLPLFLLAAIVLFLYSQSALNVINYVQIQKDAFFFINQYLGQYPNITYNLTQVGDESVFLSFCAIFLLYSPKIWEGFISASVFSLLFSVTLKNIFKVPRPPEVFNHHSFIILGKTASGYASCPSGHSITVFTTLTILLFAFMPKLLKYKILWVSAIFFIGLCIVFTRVGVGAHYPLDVIIGSIIGYISGLLGIFIIQKYKICSWVCNKKYYPIFILLILACGVSLILKVMNENLIMYDMALCSLFIPLYKITYVYVKK